MSAPVLIIGGGILGLAVAETLSRVAPAGTKITVVEKEADVGLHQSGRNSGVLHCGLHYKPGSLKARLAVSGIRKMIRFCDDHGVPYDRCGKLVVATNEVEAARLAILEERGRANGLVGLRLLTRAEMKEREPEVEGTSGLEVPEEGIVDYPAVCQALARLVAAAGHEVKRGFHVRSITRNGGELVVESNNESLRASYLINCAGLHSDRIAKLAGLTGLDVKIVPFRGEYFLLRPERAGLVRHLIYPTPDPRFPFLGVHCTRMIQGGVEIGPNAVLAFSREGYRKRDIDMGDLRDAFFFPGLWNFLNAHAAMCCRELVQSCSKKSFAREAAKLVPAIGGDDLLPGPAGVRAQAMRRDGTLVEDFLFEEQEFALHVINAPSPAATASLAIAAEIAAVVVKRLN